MLRLDGALGEGGGQVLRTALTVAVATGTAVRLERIRAGRRRPGLLAQHRAAVAAAAAAGAAQVEGDTPRSQTLTFVPSAVVPGDHRFDVGTAGSACLVLQTVLPPLLAAGAPSRLVVSGGTHNPAAPPFEFLDRAFLPLLRAAGARVTATLHRHGFHPAGGGVIAMEIDPAGPRRPLELAQRGALSTPRARVLLARLPAHIAERELGVVGRELGWADRRVQRVAADGPGNVVLLEAACEHVTEVFTGFGRRGLPAEQVAADAVGQVRRYLAAGVPVGPFLADQLLVPLALGAGGSFRTLAPTTHFTTNVEVLRAFLGDVVTVERASDDTVGVHVRGRRG